MCIQKARQAQVVLMDILLQFSLVGLALEEDLYVAKVRSRLKYGNEIWGVEQSALGFSKNEAPWLRWLYGATRRPRTEAIRWILQLQKVEDESLLAAFRFYGQTLCYGDEIEKIA